MLENIKNHIKWRGKYYVMQLISLTNIYKNKQRLIVFGSGRSGTNLLSGFLTGMPKSIEIEEPLMNSSSKKIDKIGFTGWGQYIPGTANWIEAQEYFKNFFNGKEMNPNHYFGNIWELVNADYFIFRFIRANLLMPWLISNFSVVKPIYLIRNPYSVVASQLQHPGFGGNKPIYLEQVHTTKNFKYFKEFYIKYEKMFNNAKRLEETLIIQWLMQNEYVVSHKWHNKRWVMISYEDLVSNPELIRMKIGKNICINIPPEANDKIKTPSKSMITKLEKDQINKHRNYLSEQQADSISKYLADSLFKGIYSY